MNMENDPSYGVTNAFNVDGKPIRIHKTTSKMFSNTKVEVICRCDQWVKKLGPFIDKILILSLLALFCLDRLLGIQVQESFWLIVFLFSILLYVYFHYYFILEEEIICVKNLGVEVITKTITGRTAEEFIPNLQIADVVINEVIHMQRFIYALFVLIGDADAAQNYHKDGYSKINRVITFFKFTKPRLQELKEILNDTRTILICEHCVQESDEMYGSN